MPRLPMNYQNTIIYKIVCKDINITDTYVGHTTNFDKRKNNHKTACNNENLRYYNINVYQFIRENGGWNNWEMIEIELYSCENKRQAETRERYWLEQLGATLNSYVPTRTREEYRQENREQLNEYQKEYYEANREIIIEKQKKYQKENKEIISEKNKEYRETNREQLNEYQKEYRKTNKDRISEKLKEKITCECGSIVRKNDLSRHRKSQKHLKYLDNLNNLI
jgi:predicted HicB family RNase H-like nuclease